ncbi:hypothetical protein P4824_15480, partial [Listeria monocytogenes]|nr:hypothetical protein [Listeria monocytogenes]
MVESERRRVPFLFTKIRYFIAEVVIEVESSSCRVSPEVGGLGETIEDDLFEAGRFGVLRFIEILDDAVVS